MHPFRTLWPFHIVLLAVLASGCGDTEFAGNAGAGFASKGTPTSPGGTKGDDGKIDEGKATSLTWHFRCADSKDPAPVGDVDNPAFDGGGTHNVNRNRFDGVPLTFRGTLCAPASLPRDIVFIVDVSLSMANLDAPVGGSCGRLRAIEQVIAGIPAGSSPMMSLVTFSSNVRSSTRAFYGDRETLFQALGNNPAAVVCATNGNTNYAAALDEAIALFGVSRPGASKEVYFVSDGEPSGVDTGARQAALLKSPGVIVGGKPAPASIATVMVGGANDTVLRKEIASIAPNGEPLHARTDASGLAKVLSDLAANGIAGGSLQYRAIGARDWIAVDLATHLQGFNFVLPSITIDLDTAPDGFEVLHEYQDRRGRKYSSGGKLLWIDSAQLTDY